MRFLAATAAVAELATTRTSRLCCVWALEVLTRVYELEEPTADLRALWMIHPDAGGIVPLTRVWGPVVAAERLGIAQRVSAPVPGRWHLLQGWTQVQPDGTVDARPGQAIGHTSLWLAGPRGFGWVHESSGTLGPRSSGPMRWTERTGRWPGGVALAALRRPVSPPAPPA